MPVLRCPAADCGQLLRLADTPTRAAVRCPKCGQVIRLAPPAAATWTLPSAVAPLPPTQTQPFAEPAGLPTIASPAVGASNPAATLSLPEPAPVTAPAATLTDVR